MKVIKRDGTEVPFDKTKIEIAIRKANYENDFILSEEKVKAVAKTVSSSLQGYTSVEDIQSLLVKELTKESKDLAKSYANFMKEKTKEREGNTTDKSIMDLVEGLNEEVQTENSNKDPILVSTQRDLIAGEVSKDFVRRKMYPPHLIKAHDEGIVYQHDMDYLLQPLTNCELVNLEDMFENGTVINGNMIETPKSFQTACTIATQVAVQVSGQTYGGQTMTYSHLSPFIDVSRKKIKAELIEELTDTGLDYNREIIDKIVEKRLKREVKAGVQTIQYQLETITGTNGQSAFSTFHTDLSEVEEGQPREDLAMLVEEVLRQRIKGIKNEKGVYVAPAFPKLTYTLDEGINVNEDDPYYYLTVLSAECSTKRLVPDYISAKKMRELKEGNVYPPMGCRSYLTPWKDENGEYKFYGRFNQGVTTINLVDVALSSGRDVNKFWEIFEERMEMIKESRLIRYEYLKNVRTDVAPILWEHGAIARLPKGSTIESLLKGGYSTTSIGYAGLYETVKYLTGESHTTEKGRELGLEIMQYMNDKADDWKEEYNMDFSVYGTPMESATYRFATSLKKRFGIIEGITDKSYITNSYHINVKEEIDAFSKLSQEAQFQELSPGGAISYIEMPNMEKNIPAVLAVINHIYENIQYAELNTKADFCMECNFSGEILINEDLEWYCPNCGNKDQDLMQVTRRTCG